MAKKRLCSTTTAFLYCTILLKICNVDVEAFIPGVYKNNQQQPLNHAGQISSPRSLTPTTTQLFSYPEDWKEQILEKLSTVIDPDLGMDIVTLNFIKQLEITEDKKVSFQVELTTPACPIKQEFQDDCTKLVQSLDFVSEVDVEMTSQPVTIRETESSGMSKVGSIIAVSSCKGGVGKSTTAVNLAFALSKMGAKVGIFDTDVYGPSLPTMVTPDSENIQFAGTQIVPLQHNGVKLMSFGFVNEGSAIMRGPMVTQLLDQFLGLTHWGDVDYLILDMPPGTGDIQLTLSQKLNITAAVIVTTPQKLSFVDVERGIEMFDSVNVPCIAVVENMAYYEQQTLQNAIDADALLDQFVQKLNTDEKLNGVAGPSIEEQAAELVKLVEQAQKQSGGEVEKVPLFGAGHKHKLSEQWGIEHTFSMPLLSKIAKNGDSGTPFIEEHPDGSHGKTYFELAGAVASEVAKIKFGNKGGNGRPSIVYNEEKHVIEVTDPSNDNESYTFRPKELRGECRCASCVEEMTGRQILVKSSISDLVRPREMMPTGNYALSVNWSDGHRSLYPYKQIRALREEQKQAQLQEALQQ